MTQRRLRFACPRGRRLIEGWTGVALCTAAVLGGTLVAGSGAAPWFAWLPVAIALLATGAALAWTRLGEQPAVLEIDSREFRYTRGRYRASLARDRIGSYRVMPARTPALCLYDPAGRQTSFPALQGGRAVRPSLPLSMWTPPDQVERFMADAGIPPKDRSLTTGAGTPG